MAPHRPRRAPWPSRRRQPRNWKPCFSKRVRKERRCEDVQGFEVARGPRGIGWIVTHRRLGKAGEFPVEEALSKVLPRLQAEFDLGAED